MTNTVIIFNRPTTNIQRAFGLFNLLSSKGFTRGTLNPQHPYIRIERTSEGLLYFSIPNTQLTKWMTPLDITPNYAEIIHHTFNL